LRERERDAPFLEPSFIHLSTFAVYEPPSRFPCGAPIERDARLQILFYVSSRFPSNEVPPPGSPSQSSLRERHSTLRAPFIHLSKNLVNEPPSRFPSGAPMERDARLQSLFYTIFRVPS